MKNLFFVIILLFLTTNLFAQSGGVKQYQREFTIGGRLPATILLVGLAKDSAQVEKLFEIVTSGANGLYSQLDPNNPNGNVGALIAKAGAGPVIVSDDVLFAFENAAKLSGWTNGAFDITSSGDGNYKDIKLNKGASSVELKRSGMKINFDQMINGFMAETISRLLYAANMQNAVVKVGNVFRGVGGGLTGPWKIQIQDDEGTFAHHALNLTLNNTGASAVSASQFRATKPVDPRSKKEVALSVRGVVVLMNDAIHADGIANAVFIMRPADGMKLLSKLGKGLIVDNEGKFLRSPGF